MLISPHKSFSVIYCTFICKMHLENKYLKLNFASLNAMYNICFYLDKLNRQNCFQPEHNDTILQSWSNAPDKEQ